MVRTPTRTPRPHQPQPFREHTNGDGSLSFTLGRYPLRMGDEVMLRTVRHGSVHGRWIAVRVTFSSADRCLVFRTAGRGQYRGNFALCWPNDLENPSRLAPAA